jgi:hypothetical protein
MPTREQLQIYLKELGIQARATLRAIELAREAYAEHERRLATSRSSGRPHDLVEPRERTIQALHSALAHAGMAARLLWPDPTRWHEAPPDESADAHAQRVAFAEERGRQLRELIGADDLGAFRATLVTEHLDHCDLRLDRYVESGKVSHALDSVSTDVHAGVDLASKYRVVDPTTWTVRFSDDRLALAELADAATRLLERLPRQYALRARSA